MKFYEIFEVIEKKELYVCMSQNLAKAWKYATILYAVIFKILHDSKFVVLQRDFVAFDEYIEMYWVCIGKIFKKYVAAI